MFCVFNGFFCVSLMSCFCCC